MKRNENLGLKPSMMLSYLHPKLGENLGESTAVGPAQPLSLPALSPPLEYSTCQPRAKFSHIYPPQTPNASLISISISKLNRTIFINFSCCSFLRWRDRYQYPRHGRRSPDAAAPRRRPLRGGRRGARRRRQADDPHPRGEHPARLLRRRLAGRRRHGRRGRRAGRAPIGTTMTEPKPELTTTPGAAGEAAGGASAGYSLGVASHVGAAAAFVAGVFAFWGRGCWEREKPPALCCVNIYWQYIHTYIHTAVLIWWCTIFVLFFILVR